MNKKHQRKQDYLFDRFGSSSSEEESMDDEVFEEIKIDWKEFMDAWEKNIDHRLKGCLEQLQKDGILFDIPSAMETEQYYTITKLLQECIFVTHK